MTNRFCKKQRVWFSEHLDGQPLPFWRGLLIRWHLAACPMCIRMNQSLQATHQALQALRDVDPK